jgi:hypothetical protein
MKTKLCLGSDFILLKYSRYSMIVFQAKLDRRLDVSSNVTAVNRLLAQFDELQQEAAGNHERWRLSRQLRVNNGVRVDQLREQANRVSLLLVLNGVGST